MKNEINHDRITHAIHILTTRGEITIDCETGNKSVGYHYKPTEYIFPYYNGPINHHDPRTINHALERSHIDQTPQNTRLIQDAASTVQSLANPPVSNQETLPDTPINLTRHILKRTLRSPLGIKEQYLYYVDRTTWDSRPEQAKHFKAEHNAITHKKLLPNDINPDTVEIIETTITLTPTGPQIPPVSNQETRDCNQECDTCTKRETDTCPQDTTTVSNQETQDCNEYYVIYHTHTNCYYQKATSQEPSSWHISHHKATRYPTYHEAKTAKNSFDNTIIRKT